MISEKQRKAAFLIIYCDKFGDSDSERFLIATRWSGTYGFIGGEINQNEKVKDGLIRECIEEIGIDFKKRRDDFVKLNSHINEQKNMKFYTYILKVSSEDIKKIWNEWRLNGEFAEYEISGLSLMRTDKKIMQNFLKNNFAGSSKKDLIDFLKTLNSEFNVDFI